MGCARKYACCDPFSSSLLCVKAKVALLGGYTAPHSELSAGVLVSRFMLIAAAALSKLEDKPSSSIILMDISCTISSLEENVKRLIPADIATRGDTKFEDIGLLTFWQSGPLFLFAPRRYWPISREFCRELVPGQERRHPGAVVSVSFRAVTFKNLPGLAYSHKTYSAISNIHHQKHSLNSRIRVIALVVRCWNEGNSKEILSAPKRPDELVYAERLVLTHDVIYTAHAFHKGKIASLLLEKEESLIIKPCKLGESGIQHVHGVLFKKKIRQRLRYLVWRLWISPHSGGGASSMVLPLLKLMPPPAFT